MKTAIDLLEAWKKRANQIEQLTNPKIIETAKNIAKTMGWPDPFDEEASQRHQVAVEGQMGVIQEAFDAWVANGCPVPARPPTRGF